MNKCSEKVKALHKDQQKLTKIYYQEHTHRERYSLTHKLEELVLKCLHCLQQSTNSR